MHLRVFGIGVGVPALGEHYFGVAQKAHDFIYLSAGTVQENSLQQPLEFLRFANSAHGAEACVMRGIALVMDNVLREPT